MVASYFYRVYYLIYPYIAASGYHAFFFNNIYNFVYLRIFTISYLNFNKYFDRGIFEYFGPFGIYKLCRAFYTYSQKLFPFITLGILQMFLVIIMYFTYTILLITSLYIISVNIAIILASNLGLFIILIIYFYFYDYIINLGDIIEKIQLRYYEKKYLKEQQYINEQKYLKKKNIFGTRIR